MSQLRMVPADELKIGRTFVQDLEGKTPNAVMVRSATDLGHHLGPRVVADGVEDVRTVLLLPEMSCDYAQGYALSHPVPATRLPDACRQAQRVVLDAIAVVPALT